MITLALPPALVVCLDDTAADDAARLKSLMEAVGWTFSTTPDGKSYSIGFESPDKSTTTVFISRAPVTITVSGTSFKRTTHPIYTTIWAGKTAPSPELLQSVVSVPPKLGSYQLVTLGEDSYELRFVMSLDLSRLTTKTFEKNHPMARRLHDWLEFTALVGKTMRDELALKSKPMLPE